MRLLAFSALLLLATVGHGAEKIRYDGNKLTGKAADRQQRADHEATQRAEAEARFAKSFNGLQIVYFKWYSDGWATIGVQNINTSSATFDYHQLRGVVMDTGEIVAPLNIKFEQQEIASYSLDKYQRRNFNVQFGGRRIAGVAWKERDEWRAGQEVAPTPEGAVEIARKALIAERKARKKGVLIPVKDQVVVK